MILSWKFLKVRYLWMHYLGVVISLLGVAAMVIADWLLKGSGSDAGRFALLVVVHILNHKFVSAYLYYILR